MKSLLFVAAGRIKICKFLIVFDFSYPFLISLMLESNTLATQKLPF